jgi:hypothetical protein
MYENQLFAFDNMMLSSTTNFKIPATPNNNIIFGFANRIEQSGDIARRSVPAQMFYSGGKIDGNIIISDYSDRYYNAIFIFGNLLKLKEIKNAGKLRDFLNLTDSVVWGNGTIPRKGGSNPDGFPVDFGIFNYISRVQGNVPSEIVPNPVNPINLFPSVKLMYLVSKCKQYFNIDIELPSNLESDYLNTVGVKLVGMNVKPATDISFISYLRDLSGSNLGDFFEIVTARMQNGQGGFNAPFFRAKQDVIIHLSGVPDNVFMQTPEYNFAGGYWFTKTQLGKVSTFGEALNDRDVNIFRGQVFNFFRDDLYTPKNILNIKTWGYQNTWSTFSYSGVAGLNGENLGYGQNYYLQPNLPDITFTDLLKTVAFLTHCSFYWDEATKTIKFFDFDFTNSEKIDLTGKLISKGKITRSVPEYAQSNLINCKSEEFVLPQSKLSKRYYVNNDNIEAEKTLYTFPFSEGNAIGSQNISILDTVHELDENGNPTGTFNFVGKNDIFVQTTAEDTPYLQQLQFFNGEDRLQRIIQNASVLEVRVRMYLFEYLNVRERTVIAIEGKKYVTLSATWGKNVATLTLLLIA